MSKILIAMSGGVDSSVTAALVKEQGHEAVGVTLKLWGGESDSGCCSVSDVEDARRVAEQLGIKHFVFNFTQEFESAVVEKYVASYAEGHTPNPCIECNRSIKFSLLIQRAKRLGFDGLATGHHARIVRDSQGAHLERGRDRAKDQSYVLSMLNAEQLDYMMLPVGEMQKSAVRQIAHDLGLRTAAKADSLEVCFISKVAGREEFLSKRIKLRKANVGISGLEGLRESELAFETITIGQRKGLGTLGDSKRRFVIDKDPATATVTLGTERDLLTTSQELEQITWVREPAEEGASILIQSAAHGATVVGRLMAGRVEYEVPRRRVAPGQTLSFYQGDRVIGSAVVGG